MEFMVTMRHFRKDITISVNLTNFIDETPGNDKLVELLGYYKIDAVRLNGSSLNLRASCMFLLQPPKVLHCLNGFINFQKADQIIAAEDLKICNSRVYCAFSNDRLFTNVKRAVLQNCLFKESLFKHFSHNLKELVISKRILDGQSLHTDILNKLITDGFYLTKLRLLSISCMVAEESLLVLLNKMPFPELEVLKIDNKYLRTTAARLRAHCKLPKLKKLNLRKCAVKLDAETLKICQSKLTESQLLESRAAAAALHNKRSDKF